MSKCACSCGTSCATNSATSSVYACAGASNVGKMSLDLAIKLHQNHKYRMSCAAGVGADICGFTDAAKAEDNSNLLIDGCPVGCLKQMFDAKGIGNYDHVVITEMGIAKNGEFDYEPQIIDDLLTQIDSMGL
ncbi:MAG: putative zinc-binding protein [Candidatus Cloacimonadaceae bacterium]|nr:putative zinc-binding protein [Candidatus Cloacimonadaceae bacterium]